MSDRYLFFFVSVLILFGIVFSYSLSAYFVYAHGMSQFHFFIRELFAGGIGLTLMWALSRLEPDVWIPRLGFGLFLFFMGVMVMMPFMPESVVPTINGARRWVRLPFFNLSPVEFFKVGFVFFLAWSFTRKFYLAQEKMSFGREIKTFIPYVVIFFVAVVLIAVMQNDFGQVMVLGVTLALMAFFAGSSFKLFLFLIFSSLIAGIALIFASAHRIIRIKQWWVSVQESILSVLPDFLAQTLRVQDVAVDQTYQVTQALRAVYHGGISGVGIGNGLVKLGYLSDVHTDFVLAGVAEETGVIGVTLVSLIMLMVIYRIFKIGNRSKNPVFYLFSVGIALMLASQYLMNALGVIGLIPLKGIAVPFLSYGGSSMLALCIAMGLVLMISKKARL